MRGVGPFVDDVLIVLASSLKQEESQRLSFIFKVLQGCWLTNVGGQFHKKLKHNTVIDMYEVDLKWMK